MPAKRSQLAKLTRPRLHKAVARQRLFALLDEAREHKPAICVVGPPGAGKTTLVASWLDDRGIKGIWYQVDPADADLATYFYYLGEAVKPFARKGQRRLPLLTPEYLQDVDGFARRFFRELFSRLPEGATLVLDNYQEVPADQAFHRLIVRAADEVPAGVTLIAVSRRDPPDCYARLIANENVCLVEWEDLKLTLDETRAIVRKKANSSDDDARRLHGLSGGWATGLTLLLEYERKAGAELDPRNEAGIDSVFEYFATQIFDRLSTETQRFLVGTAFLPRITASVAQSLTGNAAADRILDELYRRHLFTHRRLGVVPIYQYHALFQTFLRTRARSLLSGTEEKALALRAARLLEENDLADDAILLYREARDWAAAGRLIRSAARSLLAQGRGQTLREWIGGLPMERVEADPWLTYWLGASLIAVDQQKARLRLEQAFDRFESDGDVHGQAVAACGVIDTYYFEWSEFGAMSRWIAALERILSAGFEVDSPETELHVVSSLLIATLYTEPGHSLLPMCVERATAMLDLDVDIDHRVMAATFLLSYCALTGDLVRGQSIVAKVEPLLQHEALSPLNRLWYRTRLGYLLWGLTDYEGAALALQEAEEIAEMHGLAGLRSATILMLNYRQLVSLGLDQHRIGETCIRRAQELPYAPHSMGAWHRTWARVQFELGRGNARPAFETGADSVRAAFESGMVYVQILSLIGEARGHAEFGSHEKVMENLRRAGDLARRTCLVHLENELRLTEAYSLFRHGERSRGLTKLAFALERARKSGYTYHTRWCSTMPALCAEALAAGIETDYVKDVIRKYRLRPPAGDIAEWPWPVRILTLGGFKIVVDGEPVKFSGKVPKKPLTLLKVLIACGGQAVPEYKLIDALWPGEDADGAFRALEVNVVRLRKLLGRQDAVSVSGESVSLNPKICWVDTFAFDSIAKTLESGLAPEAFEGSIERVLALYRGDFLPGETDESWALKQRERMRGHFLRLVGSAAARYEATNEWEKAISLYRRGLEADELAESFYQGLMRCYRALARHADAMSTYRRLRQMLSVVMGIAPSEASQTLARELQFEKPAEQEAPLPAPNPARSRPDRNL